MIKQEWKNIFHNAWIIIVIIAIILIPSIYSSVFLGSMWDPYGNTKNIPVAVVNEDKEVSYNGETLHVGEELANNLRDNDSMNFCIVNKDEAKKGLEDAKYYMIITIPSDFSSHATTLLDEKPEKMTLHYTTNPGTNYIASKMDDSAIEKIKSEVSSSVTKTYAKTIFSQVDTLSKGLDEAVDRSNQLLDGMNQLSSGNNTISDNLKVLASSSLTFKDGATTLNQGLKDYTDGVLTVNNGVYALKNGVDQLNDATPTLSAGIKQLDDGAKSLNTGIQSYTQGVTQVYEGTQELVDKSAILNQGVESLSSGVDELSKGNSQVSDGLNDLSKQVSQGTLSLSQYLSVYDKISKISPDLAEILKNQGITKQTLDSLKQLGKIDEQTYQLLSSQLPAGGLPSFESMLKTLSSSMNEMNVGIQKLSQGSQALQEGINQMQTSIDTKLQVGVSEYTQGVAKVNDGLKTIQSNNTQLVNGSQALSSGISSLQQQTPTLLNGIQTIHQGINSLYDGTSTLVSNNVTLVNGSEQLTDGASKISLGASQLASGSTELGSGLNEAKDGVTTLKTGLEDGANETKMKTTDDTYDMMSSPVTITHDEISTVENNGHAMAPYMMSVALYVAGMAFVLMYPLRRGIKEAKNGWRYFASKATVMYTVSTVAAIVLITVLRFVNGFEPQQMLMTYLFAILVSAAFMSIITLLSLTTGFIGDFILLVFMIVNLGGSAGTYPLETSSMFYKMIHPFVPYTYSVNGFRKVISMTQASLNTEILVLVGIVVVCSLLTILYFQYKNKEDKHLIPEAFETNH